MASSFLLITHVNHYNYKQLFFAYAPYVREMNIWFKHVDQVEVIAPCSQNEKSLIDEAYQYECIGFNSVQVFDIKSLKSIFKTLISIPFIFFTILKAMRKTDHIHLRCPGNMGLIGAIAQMFFPKKRKTAKYAGNWDPKAKQPWSYRLQKWILSNTFLTKNMQVLVYGEWPNQSNNIKPFFTATYSDTEKIDIQPRAIAKDTLIKFLFAGTLSKGKQPLYAVQIVEELFKKGFKVNLELFGNGNERVVIQNYIKNNNLESFIFLRGNQTADFIKQKYQESHFLVLPSKSEGWPKVVAEAMFWGCLPLVTPISCVPYMLDHGKRGELLSEDINKDCDKIILHLQNENFYQDKVNKAKTWSQTFTTNYFENEIRKLLQ
jgi:glycosyltransferase involved in cell wall biosynthesis